MKSVNRTTLLGNVGADPEIRYAANGNPVGTLNIATSYSRKDDSGQWIEETEWHRCVCFGKTADVAKDYVKKGDKIYIEGRLRTRKWQDKQGTDRYTTEVIVTQLTLLGASQGSGDQHRPNERTPVSNDYAKATGATQSSAPTGDLEDDDIPF